MIDELDSLKTIKSIRIEESQCVPFEEAPKDFGVTPFDDVIPIKDCSYTNETTSAIDFYQCPCTEGFSLICKACAEKCHINHNPYFCGKGNHVCHCGKSSHVLPFYKKDKNASCIYNTFFDIIPNQMYSRYQEKNVESSQKMTLCLVCFTSCGIKKDKLIKGTEEEQVNSFHRLTLSSSVNKQIEPKKIRCECQNHHEFNPIQINGRFLQNNELKGTMLNFNVNIMFKIQDAKKNFIEGLTVKLDEYFKKESDLGNYEFFDDWTNFNAFEMFSLFFQRWKTKYTTMVPFLEHYKRDALLHLLAVPKELANRLKNGEVENNTLSGKMYYAELLFNYFIKSVFVKWNNLFSLKTIVNMSLEQRFFYLHKAKDYFKLKARRNNEEDRKEMEKEADAWQFAQTSAKLIVEAFESIVKDRDQGNWEAFNEAFAAFNRITKYLIKYNILSEEMKEKYVTIVLETLQLFHKLKGESLAKTSLSLMKSLLYLIIYRNDTICFNALGITPDANKKAEECFAFGMNDFNTKLSKIFLLTIRHKDAQANVASKLQFDYCVKKINEMMLFTKDSYLYSICKSDIQPNDLLHSCSLKIASEIVEQINPDIFDAVHDLVKQLNNENQCYFLYAESLELYLTHVVTILSKFKQAFQGYNNEQLIPEGDLYTQITDQATSFKKSFLSAALALPFFQKIDEMLHIYANGRNFHCNTCIISEDINSKIAEELVFLLNNVYSCLLEQDPSIMTILMNISPSIFIRAFQNCSQASLFNYLNKLADICISRMKYQAYDSFYFFIGCITELLESYSDHYGYLPDIMNFSSKIISNAISKDASLLTIVLRFSKVFKDLSLKEEIKTFFENLTKKVVIDRKEIISTFFETYFMFMSDLKERDCLFFNYIKYEVVDVKKLYPIITDEKNSLNPMLVVRFMRYYLLKDLSFNFNMTTSITQIEELFKKEAIVEDLNISLVKLWPKPEPKTDDATKDDKAGKKGNKEKEEPPFIVKYIPLCMDFNNKLIGKIMTKNVRLSPPQIFEWYEQVVLRPYYKLLSLSVLDLKLLCGKYVDQLYDLVLSFIDITKNVYSGYKALDNPFLSIKTELNDEEKKKLNETREGLDYIKYYELEKIISFFMGILKIIIKPKEDKQIDNDPLEALFTDSSNIKNPLYNIGKKYSMQKEKCANDQLILIKAIAPLISETDLPIREYIINYFIFKLFDKLTETDRKAYDKKDFSIQVSKLQNNYALVFLNKYFAHDAKQFQSAFAKQFSEEGYENPYGVENQKILLSYLSLYLILPSVLNEIEKLYSLDLFNGTASNNKISLAYKFGRYALKFIQNLCEKYNKENKTLFFTSHFVHKVLEQQVDKKGRPIKKELELVQIEGNAISFEQRSFLNFLSLNLRLISQNLYHSIKMQRNVFFEMSSIGKDISNVQLLYEGIGELIIELIQGTNSDNFNFIYSENAASDAKEVLLLFKNQLGQTFAKTKLALVEKQHKEIFEYNHALEQRKRLSPEEQAKKPIDPEPEKQQILFQFIITILETRDNLYDKEDLFNENTLTIKSSIFEIIQNIITQDSVPKQLIEILLKIYDMNQLIEIVIILMKGVYLKHCKSIDYLNESFKQSLNAVKLDKSIVEELTGKYREYQNKNSIFGDDFFKLASKIYLFILTIFEKYGREEAKNIIHSKLKEEMEGQEDEGWFSFITNWFKEKKVEIQKEAETNDDICHTCSFMNNIIKHCEFRVDGRSEILYFVIDPHSFLISENTLDSFVETVDRGSSTTKLNGLVESLKFFMDEINGNRLGITMNFKEGTLMNFYISAFVNVVLLLFLNGVGQQRTALSYIVGIVIVFQLILNALLILIFLTTKYPFNLDMIKKYSSFNQEFSLFSKVNAYFFKAFLFNSEIFFVNYVFILGILAFCIPKFKLFFYVLQLLTVLDFVGTIKEILIAFKLRFSQLFCMIAFLVILLYFYSNIGFYFYIDEFNTVINNSPENICQTMLECIMAYFNHGVRAGGGIGDLLEEKSFAEHGLYFLRFSTDLIFYITVILLLLNMINGVIVSTFSQIRETSTAREDDINDICFICNLNKKSFEKRKLDFDRHKEEEHNLKTYIHFFVTLKKKRELDLDETESKILDCINSKQNRCFPVKQTLYVPDLEDDE